MEEEGRKREGGRRERKGGGGAGGGREKEEEQKGRRRMQPGIVYIVINERSKMRQEISGPGGRYGRKWTMLFTPQLPSH